MSTTNMDGPMAGAKRGKGASQLWMRALEKIAPIAAHPNRLFANVIDEFAAAQGDAPALHSERENFSYRALAARTNQYARWALAQGLAKGDVVCLLMPNRPEYLAIWLGVTRVGGVVSLLNTNLTGASLAHCVKIAEPKHAVVAGVVGCTEGVRAQLPRQVWAHAQASEASRASGPSFRRIVEQRNCVRSVSRPCASHLYPNDRFAEGGSGQSSKHQELEFLVPV